MRSEKLTSETQAATDAHAAAHGELGHVMPRSVLLGVWLALMVLTVLTVAATGVDLGRYNIWLAIGIATFKASLVGLYFMHLRYDSPFHSIILVAALIFVLMFIIISSLDTIEYQPDFRPPPGLNVPE